MRLKAIQRPIIITFLGFTSVAFEFIIDFLTAVLYFANTTFNFLAGIADYLITPITSRPIFTEAVTSIFSGLRAGFNFPIWVLSVPQEIIGNYLFNSYGRELRPWYIENIVARLVRIKDKIVNGLSYPKATPAEDRREEEVPAPRYFPVMPIVRPRFQVRNNEIPAHNIGNQLDNALNSVMESKSLADVQVYLMGLFGAQWWMIGSWSADAKDQLRADIQNSRFVSEQFYAHLTEEQREDLRTNDALDSRCAISNRLTCIPMICGTRRFDLLQLLNTMLKQADDNYPHAEYAGTGAVIDEVFIIDTRFDDINFEMMQGTIDGMLNPLPPIQRHLEVEEETEAPEPPAPAITPLHEQKKSVAKMGGWLGVDVVPKTKTAESPAAPSEEELEAKAKAALELAERNRTMREARMARFGGSAPNPNSSI